MALKFIKSSVSSFLIIILVITFSEAKLEFGQPIQTEMSLYFQDWSGGGPNATVIEIIGQPNGPLNFTKFGAIFCTDDPVTEEPSESSAQIARAQGIYVTSDLHGHNTNVLISIVFTNNKYKGSTLEIQGSSAQFKHIREVAIVGGTGKFRFARGYATFETIYYDSALHYAIIRCNVSVLHY